MGEDFGWALTQLRKGAVVRRVGWKSKNAWVVLSHETLNSQLGPNTPIRRFIEAQLGNHAGVVISAHFVRHMATGAMQPGWVPGQDDLLAEDWELSEMLPVPNVDQPVPAEVDPAAPPTLVAPAQPPPFDVE